jgi:hypothetical protein
VASMVALLDRANGELCPRRQVAEKLAGLGVINVAVVATEQAAGIVLEGWLFDPGRPAGAAAAVGAPPGHASPLPNLAGGGLCRHG